MAPSNLHAPSSTLHSPLPDLEISLSERAARNEVVTDLEREGAYHEVVGYVY